MRVLAAALLASIALAAPALGAPEDLPLRLSDLPPGYVLDDRPGCNLALTGEEDTPPAVNRLLEPLGCDATFIRRWAPRGEPLGATEIESIVWPFDDAADAATMLEHARALTSFAWGVPRGSLRRRAAPALGDAALAFTTDDAPALGRSGGGTAVLWRTGVALSLVTAAGRSARVADATALALARVQQARILAPTPLSPADNDDLEVLLDDPGLGVPVVWLGRAAQPVPARPPLALDTVFAGGGPRGLRAMLEYEGGVALGLWRPRGFDRFLHSRAGRLVRGQRCARVERRGAVVIVGGHADPPRRCGRRPRDVWWAYVRADGVVVSVNVPICLPCLDGGGPYASPAALRAVIAALRPRP